MSWKLIKSKSNVIVVAIIALVSVAGVQLAGIPSASASTGHCGYYGADSAVNGLYNMCYQVRTVHVWGKNAPGSAEYGPYVKLGYTSYNICRPYERSYSYQYIG